MIEAPNAMAGWLPALTLFIGFLTGIVSDWLRHRYTSKREKEAAETTRERERETRESERRLQLFERRTAFQRETLLNLQDAIVKLTRATGRMQLLDQLDYRKTEKWGGQLFPPDLDNDAHQANVIIMVLTARVRDQSIREMVSTFRSHAIAVTLVRSERESKAASEKMVGVLEPLHERVGEVLRKLDDDEYSQR